MKGKMRDLPGSLSRGAFLRGSAASAAIAALPKAAAAFAARTPRIILPTPAFPQVPADLLARLGTDAPTPQIGANTWNLRRLWLVRKGYPNEVAHGVPFCVDGVHLYPGDAYHPGYNWICWLLRDHSVPWRDGYVPIDVVTIQAMWEVQQILFQLGISAPITITDGYRTPATNAAMRVRNEQVARFSQHTRMKAVDMYVDGVTAADLFRLCYSRRISCGDIDHRTPNTGPGDTCGGVGYYDDGHIHLDSGSRRYWIN
jgi:uncharacterized protein YcbK (DUF882 family)